MLICSPPLKMQNLADLVMSVDLGSTSYRIFFKQLILIILTWQQNSKPVDRYPRSIIIFVNMIKSVI